MTHENLFLVLGPPGTGKTTKLTKWLTEQASLYGGENVMACSYTRAAAAELAGRDLNIPKENLGTLHALCYRHLDNPKLAVDHEAEFGKDFPQYKYSGTGSNDVDNPYEERQSETHGDRLRDRLEVLRARRRDSKLWPPEIVAFSKAWTTWKERNNLLDFTDLLEICLRDCEEAPGGPAVGLLDEGQDSPQLQIDLALKWAERMEKFIISGDDDQTIFGFAGADPALLLNLPVQHDKKMVLSQSHRLPRTVHALANNWIQPCSRREPKQYNPRDFEGEVLRGPSHYKYPEPILKSVEKYLADGKRVMFLASCRDMLNPLKAVLRKRAIPFHNPYSKRGDWNPLRRGDAKHPAAVDRVLAFLPSIEEQDLDDAAFDPTASLPAWQWHDVYLWMDCLDPKGMFRYGTKEWLESKKENFSEFDAQELITMLETPVHDDLYALAFHDQEATQQAITWWMMHWLPEWRKRLSYQAAVARRWGGSALLKTPPVIISTVHACKGSESDVVVLYPDVSPAGMAAWSQPGEPKDSVRRIFYVGISRARETLILCPPASRYSVPISTRPD